MSNYRQPFGVSYLDNGRNGYNSGYSKNYNHGYSNKNSPTLSIDEGHNLGELQFILENQRKKFKQTRQKFEHDLDAERKLRIQFQNKLIKLKDQFSRREVNITELQFKVNNLLHQNQDLIVQNQRMKMEQNRLQQIYGSKIQQLEIKLNLQTKNYDETTRQYNQQFQKFKKEGQEYIEQLTFDYERKLKGIQQKYKSSQMNRKQLSMQNKKLNDILISNKLSFEEQVRDLKNRAREEEIKKIQSITKSHDQKLKMMDQTKDNIIKKNNQLLRILQDKDRQLQDVQNDKNQQISRLRQEQSDLSQQMTHLNYLITKLKSEISEKDNMLGRSYADNDSELQSLRQQLQLKKQEVYQLSAAAKDLRIVMKSSQNEWQSKRRDLVQRANHFEKQSRKYKQQYERICQVLKSKINDTISAVSYKR